jgi:hypothetical protein
LKAAKNDPGRRQKGDENRVEAPARDETRAGEARPQVHRETGRRRDHRGNCGDRREWARERKAAILARRGIDPPHEFIQLQIRRLSEAMLVAYSAMGNGNLHAVDQVVP